MPIPFTVAVKAYHFHAVAKSNFGRLVPRKAKLEQAFLDLICRRARTEFARVLFCSPIAIRFAALTVTFTITFISSSTGVNQIFLSFSVGPFFTLKWAQHWHQPPEG